MSGTKWLDGAAKGISHLEFQIVCGDRGNRSSLGPGGRPRPADHRHLLSAARSTAVRSRRAASAGLPGPPGYRPAGNSTCSVAQPDVADNRTSSRDRLPLPCR